MITLSHGGPTSFSAANFKIAYQFWTTRGFAILDVNYSGSTGFGREYRDRLKGNWGIVDVQDCIAGAVAMGTQQLADPARLAIRGGSAGGFTTLNALTSSDIFGAGISSYGIADLEALAKDTHKFEARYSDSLVGPYPEDRARYVDRSPINHLDQLAAPILLLQGTEDTVVPPQQAEMLADAARLKHLPVALIMFEGEGHGFRRAETIKASIEAQIYFLSQIFGFEPADPVSAIPIDNLKRMLGGGRRPSTVRCERERVEQSKSDRAPRRAGSERHACRERRRSGRPARECGRSERQRVEQSKSDRAPRRAEEE